MYLTLTGNEHVGQFNFLPLCAYILLFTKIDLGVINKFLEVGKITNMEFASDKDRLNLRRRQNKNGRDFEPPKTTLISN